MRDKTLKRLKKEWELVGKDDNYRLFIKGDMTGGMNNEQVFANSGNTDTRYIVEHLKNVGFRISEHNLLEIGCGPARMAGYLSRYVYKYTGIDISSTIIERAKERCPGIDCRVADNLSGFNDGDFDIIFSYGTLQHIPKNLVRKYFEEGLRVLGNNGCFVFQLPLTEDENATRISPLYLHKDIKLKNAVSFRYWTKKEFKGLINGYKFISSFKMLDESIFYIIQK